MTSDMDENMTGCERCRGLLDEWRQGTLPPEVAAGVEEHLAECSDCRAELAVSEQLGTLLREESLSTPDPADALPDGYWEDLNARVHDRLRGGKVFPIGGTSESGNSGSKAPEVRSGSGRKSAPWWLAAAASIAAVGVLTYIAVRPPGEDLNGSRSPMAYATGSSNVPAAAPSASEKPAPAAASDTVLTDATEPAIAESLSSTEAVMAEPSAEALKESDTGSGEALSQPDDHAISGGVGRASGFAVSPPRREMAAASPRQERRGLQSSIQTDRTGMDETDAVVTRWNAVPPQESRAEFSPVQRERRPAAKAAVPAAAPASPMPPSRTAAQAPEQELRSLNGMVVESQLGMAGAQPGATARAAQVVPYFDRAEIARLDGRYREAVDLYEQAAVAAPESTTAARSQLWIGDLAAERLNDPDRARKAWTACLQPPLNAHFDAETLAAIRERLESIK